MLRILVIGTLLVSLAVGVRSHPALFHGWTGGCSVVRTTETGSDTETRQCYAGRLSGAPDLTRQGCTAATVGGPSELWRCPASAAAEYKLGP
jgi:hypothetical protein